MLARDFRFLPLTQQKRGGQKPASLMSNISEGLRN
jgi:hypothetical protein